jgi:hypothetical protein
MKFPIVITFVRMDSTEMRLVNDQYEYDALLISILGTATQYQLFEPPNGWELVPIEPTKRMLMCFKHEWITKQANECYEMLLAAAPKPEVKS